MATKIIISGGGSGGHIFPAVSIANEIKRREPQADILFVGAKEGMELTVVPKYGYPIEAVWISGLHRQLNLRNIFRNALFPIKLITSIGQSRRIIKRFQPQIVVGVGGFASGPLGRAAAGKKIPLVLCEQNAFPGLVNRWLAPKATKILLGNEDAIKHFPKEKITVTGNPIRSFDMPGKKEAKEKLGLNPGKKVILSLGGSLGAVAINQALLENIGLITQSEVQLFWQSGKRYYERLKPQVPTHPNVKFQPFIDDMATAYAAADVVISRAGGSTISELIALEKPSILVPSPNVAEDHQTKNALSLSEKGAAKTIKDSEAKEKLLRTAIEIVENEDMLAELEKGIGAMEKHDAAKEIVDEVFELIDK